VNSVHSYTSIQFLLAFKLPGDKVNQSLHTQALSP